MLRMVSAAATQMAMAILAARRTAPSRRAWITVFCAAVAAGPLLAENVELQVKVTMAASAGEPVTVPISLNAIPVERGRAGPSGDSPLLAKGRLSESLEINATIPATARFDLPPNTSWRLEVSADGYWAQALEVDLEPQSRSVDLALYPAGWVEGVVRPPRGETAPADVEVRLQAPPDAPQKVPLATVTCPLSDDIFRCLVPSAKLDLRIRAPGYIAHYFWDVAVPWRGNRPLGSLELRRGASVVGWIEGPIPDFKDVEVELSPQLAGFTQADSIEHRHRSLSLTEGVNRRGFFQVSAVPPGSYVLTARHPTLAPAREGPVVVKEASETELDPIELEPLASLSVVVNPPVDPYHRFWRLSLLKQSPDPSHWDLVEEATASDLGTWDRPGLEPTEYSLRVEDSRGSRWASQRVSVTHAAPPLEIDVPLQRLEGYVTWAGEPVPSPSVILTEHLGGAKASRTGTEEGRFYVFLPRGKTWDVVIEQVELQVIAVFEKVEVPRKKKGDPWSKMEFEIPDTTIEGRVVMADGSALPEAAWIRSSKSEGRYFTTDGAGLFEIRGMLPGKVALLAEIPETDLRSERLLIDISDGERLGPFELELRPDARLSGMVLSPAGAGIPGARIVLTLVNVPLLFVPEEYTDMDGVFDIPLPAAASEVLVTVFPPGFAVAQERFKLSDEGLLVTAGDVGGTVIVEYEGAEELEPMQRGRLKIRTNLLQDFVLGHPFALQDWAELNGVSSLENLVIPMLAPGWYTVCVGGEANGMAHRGLALPPEVEASCASGNLAPHGELVLRIPSSVWRPVVAEKP